MLTVNTYLNFAGNTMEAFEFYKSVFNTEFLMVSRFSDHPDIAQNMAEHEKDKLMHIALPINEHHILMGTDCLESQGHTVTMGNNVSISIGTTSKKEADELFNKLKPNAIIQMPMEQMFWGDYFGMLTDQFGIQWMVAFDTTK